VVTLKDKSGGVCGQWAVGEGYWMDEGRLRSWDLGGERKWSGVRTSPRNCQSLHLREIFLFFPIYYGVPHPKMKC